MKIHSLFPSLVTQKQVVPAMANLNRQLVRECYKFSEIDRAGVSWSKKNYPGGYTSYGSITNLYNVSPYFAELKKKIDKTAAHFASHLEMDIDASQLHMTSLWINIMPKGVYHTMHIHPLSVLSGTYYLQIPNNTSGLKFEDPRMTQFMCSPPRKTKASVKNQRFFEIKPKVGQVILFESWMRHEVPANPSKADRISISFNYDWI